MAPVKGDAVGGAAHGEATGGHAGALRVGDAVAGPVARPELRHGVAGIVCHPDDGPVEGEVHWTPSEGPSPPVLSKNEKSTVVDA